MQSFRFVRAATEIDVPIRLSYTPKTKMKHRLRSGTKVILPTDAELLILDALWELGEGTVEDVVNRSPSNPRANYKTVQTLLRIMENKGFVKHTTRGRAFVFMSC